MSHVDPILAGVLLAVGQAAEEEVCADPEHCRYCCCEDLDEWGLDDEETGAGFDCPWCAPEP